MPYTNRETGLDDEQDAIQRLMGGQQNRTMPVGPGVRADDTTGAASNTGATSGGSGMDARKALGGYGGRGTMLGFNTAMDYPDDKAANSVKNTFGRIASRYGAKPSSLDAIMADPDFQRFFPNARRVPGGAGDRIDFGGVLSDFESGVPVGEVDVLGNADPNADSADGFTWQDLANDAAGPAAGSGGMNGGLAGLGIDPSQMNLDALGESDTLAKILEALSGQAGQDPNDPLAAIFGGR